VLQTLRSCFLVVSLLSANLLLAQDFSADIVNPQKMGMKKIYATKDKVRFEGADDRQSPMGPVAAILDESQNRFFLLFAQRHMYMDSLPMGMKSPILTKLWHVQNVDDACPQWKKVLDQAGTNENWGSCTKMGNDAVNGRSTVEYEGVSKKGEKSHFWVDRELHCVIKSDEGSGGGFELRNIQEASQPAGLFEIPAGYTKFDMGAMTRSQ
jgi:hypothetical protein